MSEHAVPQKGPPPILRITPTEIHFKHSLNRLITESIKLINPSNELIAYKVKTTAPKRYCVRPNIGLIKPGEQVEVQVMLNLTKDPPKTLNVPDKFQIQSVIVRKEQADGDIKALWPTIAKDQVMKQKLKCYIVSTSKGSENKANGLSEDLLATAKDTVTQNDSVFTKEKIPVVDALENSDEQQAPKGGESQIQSHAPVGDVSRKSLGPPSNNVGNRNLSEVNSRRTAPPALTSAPVSSTNNSQQPQISTLPPLSSASGGTSNDTRATAEPEKRNDTTEQIKKMIPQNINEFLRPRKPRVPAETTNYHTTSVPLPETKHTVTRYFYWILIVIIFLFGIWVGRRSKG
jgi:hypothetical protein